MPDPSRYVFTMSDRLLLVVDLEATCWDALVEGKDHRQTVDDMEIIEFGCVITDTRGSVADARSFLVRPQLHPVLSEFCTSLTRLEQAMVDRAPVYPEVVLCVDQWLANYDLAAWGSWGNYDHRQILAEDRRHACAPGFMRLPHINLKQRWCQSQGANSKADLQVALRHHGLTFQGMYHRGVDDALNIARLLPFFAL